MEMTQGAIKCETSNSMANGCSKEIKPVTIGFHPLCWQNAGLEALRDGGYVRHDGAAAWRQACRRYSFHRVELSTIKPAN